MRTPFDGSNGADGAAVALDADLDHALCRSVLYEVASAALRFPDGTLLARLRSPDARAGLVEAAATLEGERGPLARAVIALVDAAASSGDLAVAYQRLFGHTARGAVSPYETEYGVTDPFRQSQELADIAGFYRAFGLDLGAATRERGDHVAVECEFLAFLSRKQAYLASEGRREELAVALEAERDFLRCHLARFGRGFAAALSRPVEEPFYRAAGELCFQLLTAASAWAGVEPGPTFLPLAAGDTFDVPMACGDCGDGCAPGEAPFGSLPT